MWQAIAGWRTLIVACLIARLHGRHADFAVFSRGQFCRVLLARRTGLSIIEARHLSFDPASLSVLGYNLDHPKLAVIAIWNAVSAALLADRQCSP